MKNSVCSSRNTSLAERIKTAAKTRRLRGQIRATSSSAGLVWKPTLTQPARFLPASMRNSTKSEKRKLPLNKRTMEQTPIWTTEQTKIRLKKRQLKLRRRSARFATSTASTAPRSILTTILPTGITASWLGRLVWMQTAM